MITKDKQQFIGCQRCGGTIGPITKIEQKLPPNVYVAEYTEIWFKCLYCEDQSEPAYTLVDLIIS